MAVIIKHISIDVARKNLFFPIIAKQNDVNSRFLHIQLLNEGIDMAVDATADVSINAKRSDGATDDFAGTVNDDGTVIVPLAQWMLELAGDVRCDVSIVREDRRLTTMTFWLEVQKAIYNGTEIFQEE